ncbi:MAG TPA: hypothetical protein VEY30_00915, partial [Myxococcaceae bacterium]|nr:hypothetical protein [Myxococcaceae bacterium]
DSLLGEASPGVSAPPRWWALVRAAAPVAFAFDTLERHLAVPRTDIQASRSGAGGPHVTGLVRVDATARPLLSMASILDAVVRGGG